MSTRDDLNDENAKSLFYFPTSFRPCAIIFSNSLLPSESSGSSSAAPPPMEFGMEKEIDITAKEKIPPQLGDTQRVPPTVDRYTGVLFGSDVSEDEEQPDGSVVVILCVCACVLFV